MLLNIPINFYVEKLVEFHLENYQYLLTVRTYSMKLKMYLNTIVSQF